MRAAQHWRPWVVAFMVAGLIGGCGGGTRTGTGRLAVVTAFYPLELTARRVGGDLVTVSNLTPPGGEPHDLELKPSDVRALQTANLILYFGKGFQPAVENAVSSLPDKRKAVDVLKGIALKRPLAGEAEKGLDVDPHVWLSPPLMAKIVDTVADAIALKLPPRSSDIARRASVLRDELSALDGEYWQALAHCMRHEIFTSHAAFGYLADRYKLRQIAISGLSPEAEPSSKRLQDVARRAQEAHATTIFFETLVSPRVSKAVARIVGARTAVLDPIEGLTGEERAAGADYFSIMRRNLAALEKALGCAA